MVSPAEAKATLTLLSGDALATVVDLIPSGRPALLQGVPQIVAYYTLGSAALAADHYEDERDLAPVRRLYVAEPIIPDRAEKIGRAVAWATEEADPLIVSDRLAEVVPLEVARAFRDTILTNRRRDPESVGWRRIASGRGCKMCQMLAARGAVYKEATARFATHPACRCTAQPVFRGQPGEEASVMQYTASKRARTPQQQAALRDYLNTHYPDAHG